MSKLAKALTAAAGNAGGAGLMVEDVFSTYLYTGTGSALDITNNIDLSGEGGAVWIKNRSNISNHALFDTERGAEKLLFPDDTAAEQDRTADNDSLGAFNADGFSLQASTGNRTNESGSNFASWTFRKAEKFFDVVTYTGNGTTQSISHNLGSTPGVIIVKNTQSSTYWAVYHGSVPAYVGFLNATNAFNTSNTQNFGNNTNPVAPTDSVFTVGQQSLVNSDGETYVAYLFASDAGGFGDDGSESIIKCGSFDIDGVGNATVNLGYEPQFVIIKSVEASSSWAMFDNMRGIPVSDTVARLFPNKSGAEDQASDYIVRPTATGFVATATGFTGSSVNGFIYIAIRRPMKTPESGTEVFAAAYGNGSGSSPPTFTSGFAVDSVIGMYSPTTYGNAFFASRLTGNKVLRPSGTNVEGTETEANWDYQDGAFDWSNLTTYFAWMFKRATGFFDVVAYTGTGVAGRTVAHNLGVAPELMIVKSRSGAFAWAVYANPLTASNRLLLNSSDAASSANYWNSTEPTDSVFTVDGNYFQVNGSSATYIAYLFATLAGVSKVGSYTGTGSNVNVDCGFSAGARFILIKRTDSTGDWYVWDSVRGIVAGNDPYKLLNTDGTDVTSTDYIDPLASGFTVTSSAPAALNASGGNYIFMAIS